jgi:hypothetical protein
MNRLVEDRINLIDNIRDLWKQINYKTGFIELCAKELDRSPNTIHNHWFARFWQVPADMQIPVIKLMQKTINNQITK